MIKSFKDFRESSQGKCDETLNSKISSALQRRRDSLAQYILSKLRNFVKTYSMIKSGLPEELLIESEMLILNSDIIFKDAEVQVDRDCIQGHKSTNTITETKEIGIETDEAFEIEIEHTNEEQESVKKPKIPFSIMITDENKEQVVAFEKLISDFSQIEDEDEISFASPRENFRKFELNDPITPTYKKSVHGFFKFRQSEEKETQTDDQIFLELSKKDEEELLNWMIKDQQNYLKTIQRQIFTKKNELYKMNHIATKHSVLLSQSYNIGESRLPANSSFSFEASIDEDLDFLKGSGIISEDIDLRSWKEGYNYGYEKGRIDAMETEASPNIIAKVEQPSFASSDMNGPEKDDSNDSMRSKHKKSTLGVDDIMKNRKKATKFQEFHFQRKETRNQTQKVSTRLKFMDSFLDDNIKSITKRAKMSRKMVVKTISYLYSLAVSKGNSEFESLSNFIYEEFISKYTQQAVAIKKILDFMSGLLKYPDSRKVVNFIKLLGISHKIGLENYALPKQSFNFLIKLMRMIERSNLGIISVDDGSDYQFIPAIRAIECSRELLSQYLDSHEVQNIINGIERNSHPDPKKINKFGIVEVEFLQETLLVEFDTHNRFVLTELSPILHAFCIKSVNNTIKILKLDAIMLFRHISTDKFVSIFGTKPGVEVLDHLCNCDSSDRYLPLSKIIDLCFQNNLLLPNEIINFIKSEVNENSSRELAVKNIAINQADFLTILNNKEQIGVDDVFLSTWETRMKNLL